MRLARMLLVPLVLLAGIVHAPTAWADGEIAVHVVSVDDSAFPTISIVLSVDRAGRPLSAQEPVNFDVTDNGRPATIARVARVQDETIATAVVLTVDTSGSMDGENLEQARTALAALLGRVSPADTVALLTFASDATVAAPFGTGRDVTAAAIGAMAAEGHTALYKAVAQSGALAAGAGANRKLVILLTDGEDSGEVSGLSQAESLALAEQSQAIYYVIGLGSGADAGYLSELATRTGGRYLVAPAAADLEAGYQAIEETLRGQIVLTVETTAPPDPLDRTIGVSVSGAGTTGSASYSFRSTRVLPTPTAVSSPTRVSTTGPVAEEAEEDGSGPPVFGIVAGIAGAAAIAGAGLGYMQIRRAARPVVPENPTDAEIPSGAPGGPAHPIVPVAFLVPAAAIAGGGPGESISLPMDPVSVGTAEDCAVRLKDASGMAPLHARLWWRDGAVMLHAVGSGETTVNGSPVVWASLRDGDTVTFGPHAFTTRYAGRDAAGVRTEPSPSADRNSESKA